MTQRVRINVSGEIYETKQKTLNRYPNTLLSNLNENSSCYCYHQNEYFLDRNRQCFGAILFFYQSHGMLRCPPDIPSHTFVEECRFYKLPKRTIDEFNIKEGILPEIKIENNDDDDRKMFIRRLWEILEYPEKSYAAKIFARISLGFIIASILSACLETVPAFRVESKPRSENIWFLIELIVNIWFLIELVTRFIASPSKYGFTTSFLNWIDAVVVIPYFLTFLFKQSMQSLRFLRMFRLFRVFRFYRASKHLKRMKIVTEVGKQCIGDMQMLLLCFCILILLGGSLIYYSENATVKDDQESQFTNIPDSLYWATITITSVGYGDICPITPLGRFLTGSFMVFGAITMSLPIYSIVTKFITMYVKNIEGDRIIL